ncbi:D-alanyl-D-alanine carboxypeptidase (penicillin-binding protein 5/6) [Dichotomicrobium thermohalophilum]|uniref:serine-type D-Ala-D-Ala carboxypeptidase n=1 Tax=Dichotomicrobium thermohalophilum TaxID=933063 RepID=A0A397Q5X6_9HYPH|nr:D-alanyl-D-alanine carboxypeptidase (penicillin-binding protein 5/6) [Dichotomicrobium thermohalophilum]
MRRFFITTWTAILAVVAALVAQPALAAFQSDAPYAFLMDYDTGAVLYNKRGDEPMPPASMSKLMTLAVVFKALKEGRLDLDDEFVVSENAWRTGGAPSGTSAMFAPINSSVTVEELIRGVAIQSGNDASIVLAEGLAGSEEGFARLMNDYADDLGLENSNFVNSTGLPDPNHYMSARDLAVLARHVIREYPNYYHYFGEQEFKYRRHRFYNRNRLVRSDKADGLKTGYTSESGYGVVASAENDGRRMIAVVNGLETRSARRNEAIELLNWGLRSFKEFKLFDAGDIVGTARVWGGESRFVDLTGKGDVTILLPRATERERISAEIAYIGPLYPPIEQGEKIAEIRVTTDEGISNSAPLYAAEDVGKGGVISRGFDTILMLAFGWLL